MFLKEALLLLAGLAAGSTVAAGVYAFLVVIGVYPRLIGKTATASKGKIFLYETIIALGGLFGNVVDLFTEKGQRQCRRQSCGRRQQKAVAERELVLDFW